MSEEQVEQTASMREDPVGACKGAVNGCLLVLAGIGGLGGLVWLVLRILGH